MGELTHGLAPLPPLCLAVHRDTAGQERYHSLAPMYYRGAAAAVIVYDITSEESFTRAQTWVKELQQQGNPNLIMALAGGWGATRQPSRVHPAVLPGYVCGEVSFSFPDARGNGQGFTPLVC